MIDVIRQWLFRVFMVALLSGLPMAQAQQQIEAAGSTWYGEALAAGDGLVAVGSEASDFVDIYRRTADGWQRDGRVLATDGNSFGYRAALGGGWLAIANRNIAVGGWPNYVDLFRRNDGNWSFVQRVATPNALPFDSGYIHKMAVGADSLVVSLVRYGAEGEIAGYSTWYYDYAGGTWSAARQLLSPYVQRWFGVGLSMDGDRLAVADLAAPISGGYGAASVYRRIGGTWMHTATLITPQPSQLAFGLDVALCGKRLAVTATPLSNQPLPRFNRIFLYAGEDIVWGADGPPLLSPLPSASQFDERFGTKLACSHEALATRANLRSTVHAVSLTGERTLQQLTVAQASYSAGDTIAIHGGDVLVADYWGPEGPGPGLDHRGLVFAFNGAVDSIFVQGFE